MSEQTLSRPAARLHLEGGRAPFLPCLAEGMAEDPALIDALAAEFAPVAAGLASPQAYWLGFNGWMTDRLSGPIMDGEVGLDALPAQAWAVYASSYWGGMELREDWGMPPVIERLGLAMQPPYASVQQGVADAMAKRRKALEAGGQACLELLPELLREETTYGPVHAVAYNAGVQVIKTEDPPVGQRRPNRAPRPATVRINARDFMRVDYEMPAPGYLRVWRSAFERAVAAHPQAYDAMVAGAPGQKSLREIWAHAVGYGNTTWGGGAQDNWTDGYFDEALRWSTVLNLGLEAIALASFVAVLEQDPEAARRAVMGNALYVGSSSAWLLGLLDTGASLPKRVES